MKRAFDAAVALLGLVALAPLLAVIALAVWIEDRHSPIYAGRRVGRGGVPFRMLKFRTMIPHAWKTGVSSTAATDPRITRAGALLRRGKLDELPQLLNVLCGQMSFVGPRPQVPSEVALYTPAEHRLLAARPGVTDLASIVFADEAEILAGASDPDALYRRVIHPWKSRLALLYLDRASFATDLHVMALTLLSAVSRRRALDGVQRILATWDADPELRRVAARIPGESLPPHPAQARSAALPS
jgi:lipopolysaccharide/colanic/teichoic acid biosynthesis glycosyltransferase